MTSQLAAERSHDATFNVPFELHPSRLPKARLRCVDAARQRRCLDQARATWLQRPMPILSGAVLDGHDLSLAAADSDDDPHTIDDGYQR